MYRIINISAQTTDLDSETLEILKENAKEARVDIIHQVTNPGKSGHPGGGMSSTDILTYIFARFDFDRDFFMVLNKAYSEYGSIQKAIENQVEFPDVCVISHAHISSGYYPHVVRRGITLNESLEPFVLDDDKNYGFPSIEEAVRYMRCHHRQTFNFIRRPSIVSPFGGHLERRTPSVAWGGGNLGQCESAAVAFAYYLKLRGVKSRVILGVGDGGSAKGQAWEAAHIASNLQLDNLIVWCDFNNAQVMGHYHDVTGKMDLKTMYQACGFKTLAADGHDFNEIHKAFSWATAENALAFIEFKTKMGKGSPYMENEDYKCHGVGFDNKNPEKAKKVIEELGGDPLELDDTIRQRMDIYPVDLGKSLTPPHGHVQTGARLEYKPGEPNGIEPRKAFGAALQDLDRLNSEESMLFIGNDCDLGDSTHICKLKRVVQHGIREHHACMFAAAISVLPDVVSFYSAFGVFGTSEVYNQLRLANANHSNLKVFLTHVGISVGEDDVTHHCLDYIALARNLTDFTSVSVPDGNFADAITRYAASAKGNFIVTMPRAQVAVITNRDGDPFYDKNYAINPNKYDCLRKNDKAKAAIIAHGIMTGKALEVYKLLKSHGIYVNVYAAPFVKNVDKQAVKEALETKNAYIYEDHFAQSGLGSIIADAIINDGELRPLLSAMKRWKVLGVETLGPSGFHKDLYKYHRLDTLSVTEELAETLS